MIRIAGIILKSLPINCLAGLISFVSLYSITLAGPPFPRNVNGFFHLTWVNSETGGESSRTFNQEYSIFWKKRLVPRLEARANMRYHNLGIHENLGENAWRQEYQPSGELIWNHPYFAAGGNIRRQKSTSNNEATNLIRENIGTTFSTKLFKYPILNLRYSWDRTFNELDRDSRDTRERRIQLSLDYVYHSHSLYYNFSRGSNKNLASGLNIMETRHIFRWDRTSLWLDDKLRISSGYNFSQRSQTTEQSASGSVLTLIPIRRALYGHDVSPDYGELDSVSSLMDGNISDPAQPNIDIGGGLLDRNIGVDLGFEQSISALHIYTDRPSGPQLSWSIYISADNLTWNLLSGIPAVEFNANFNRYEIHFSVQKTRYIKAVNSGFNDVMSVLVTEVQVLIESTESARYTKKRLSHLLDLGGVYFFSDKLESSFDLTYRNEPRGDFTDSRDQLFYALSTRHSPSSKITQIVQYQAGYDDYKERDTREEHMKISYALLTKPLETLEFSLSTLMRNGYSNGMKKQETKNVFLQANGNVLPGLDIRGEAGFGRNDYFESGNKVDTWSYRMSSESYITRSIDAVISFSYQSAKNLSKDDSRIKRQLSIYSNYRVTNAILLRVSITINNEEARRYISQDYNLSWNAGPKLTLGSSAAIIDSDNDIKTERYSARLSYLISSRTTFFISYFRNEFSLADQPATTSIQMGLKSGF